MSTRICASVKKPNNPWHRSWSKLTGMRLDGVRDHVGNPFSDKRGYCRLRVTLTICWHISHQSKDATSPIAMPQAKNNALVWAFDSWAPSRRIFLLGWSPPFPDFQINFYTKSSKTASSTIRKMCPFYWKFLAKCYESLLNNNTKLCGSQVLKEFLFDSEFIHQN